MSVDWDKTINEILAGTLACQACNALGDEMVVGYTRSTEAAEFAARCQECTDKSDCDARKLVVVCEACASRYRVNGQLMTEAGWMGVQLDECRRNLEESLDYLSTYWKEEAEIEFADMSRKLEEVDPDTFREEDGWAGPPDGGRVLCASTAVISDRQRACAVPTQAGASQYVKTLVALGYTSSSCGGN